MALEIAHTVLTQLEGERRVDTDKERLLAATMEAISTICDQFDAFVEGVRGDLARALGGRKILVVDAAFNVPYRGMQRTLDALQQSGYGPVAQLVIQKLFGGQLPQTTTGLFQSLLGAEVSLSHLGLGRTREVTHGNVGAILFSGSPACFSRLPLGRSSVVDDVTGMTDFDVYNEERDIYLDGKGSGLPAVGVCGGHQLLTLMNMGRVVPLDQPRKGYEPLRICHDRKKAVRTVIGDNDHTDVRVYVAHGDEVVLDESRSIPFAFADIASDKAVVHGAIHSPVANLDSDHFANADRLNGALDEGFALDLGVQGHPEQTLFYLLVKIVDQLNSGSSLDTLKIGEKFTLMKKYLQWLNEFFRAHKMYRVPVGHA